MSKKELGSAQYEAFRAGGLVEIVASGVTPGINIKVDIEQLEFFIYPPMFGLYFLMPDIVLPALHPFCYKERVAFPKESRVITILDADGKHGVKIQEIEIPEIKSALPSATDPGFCVFSWIGTDKLQIANCDAILPSVYARVFGPAAFGDCEAYVNDNQGH